MVMEVEVAVSAPAQTSTFQAGALSTGGGAAGRQVRGRARGGEVRAAPELRQNERVSG